LKACPFFIYVLQIFKLLTTTTATIVVLVIVVTTATAEDEDKDDYPTTVTAVSVTEKVTHMLSSFRLHYILLRKAKSVTV